MRKGRFRARLAEQADMAKVMDLRACVFRDGEDDRDRFDGECVHGLVEDTTTERVVATFRALPFLNGTALAQGYSAQFYDLSKFESYPDPLLEIGRFAIAADLSEPDVLRLAWAFVAEIVDDTQSGFLLGCTSFAGVDPRPYADAFAWLATHHLAPPQWRPLPRAMEVHRFEARPVEAKTAFREMPSLLRSYLALGGWVSDHAVVDRSFGTLHVFTGVDVAAIPPERKRALLKVKSANDAP